MKLLEQSKHLVDLAWYYHKRLLADEDKMDIVLFELGNIDSALMTQLVGDLSRDYYNKRSSRNDETICSTDEIFINDGV